MTEARQLVYTNALYLADRLMLAGAGDAPVDPVEAHTIAESIGRLLAFLRDGDDTALPECPALEQWRRRALEERGADSLTVAAAWELTAVQCDQAGAYDLAEKCRRNAVYAMKPRRAA